MTRLPTGRHKPVDRPAPPHLTLRAADLDTVHVTPPRGRLCLQACESLLNLAEDCGNAIWDRVKALGSVSRKMDVFYSNHVAALRTLAVQEVRVDRDVAYRYEPEAQLRRIRKQVTAVVARQYRCWQESIVPALAERSVQLVRHSAIGDEQKRAADQFFHEFAFPILTPMAIDVSHPKPTFQDRALYLGALLRRRALRGPQRLFAVVQLPGVLPRFVRVRDGHRSQVVLLEQVVGARLFQLFGGYDVIDWTTFRFTQGVTASLVQRQPVQRDLPVTACRTSKMVRLEVARGVSQPLLRSLVAVEALQFPLHHALDGYSDVQVVPGPIDLGALLVWSQARGTESVLRA